MIIYEEKAIKRGIPIQPRTDEQNQIWFAYFNAQSPGVEGVSIDDFSKAWQAFAYALNTKMSNEQVGE